MVAKGTLLIIPIDEGCLDFSTSSGIDRLELVSFQCSEMRRSSTALDKIHTALVEIQHSLSGLFLGLDPMEAGICISKGDMVYAGP